MAEGTDVTSLAPVITLASGATITSRPAAVQDFSQQVDYTVIAEDGSTVIYMFLAYTQEKTRGSWSAMIYCRPSSGAGTTDPAGNLPYDDRYRIYITANPNAPTFYFSHWEVFNYSSTTAYLSNPLNEYFFGNLEITAVFQSDVQYTVTVQSENTNGGTVSGGGTCYAGESVPVSALPKAGYTFEGWYLNGSKISGSASFNYTPSASCTLIAKFNSSPPVISGPPARPWIMNNTIIATGSSVTYNMCIGQGTKSLYLTFVIPDNTAPVSSWEVTKKYNPNDFSLV